MKKKVLIVGEYLPASFVSKEIVDKLALEVREIGAIPILISPSWCEVTNKKFFGDVNQLSDDCYFERRYFVDPIQVRIEKSCCLTAMYSLICNIIDNERPCHVIFAEKAKYLPLVALVKLKYKIGMSYYISDDALIDMNENVNIPYIFELTKLFDCIIDDGEKVASQFSESYGMTLLGLEQAVELGGRISENN